MSTNENAHLVVELFVSTNEKAHLVVELFVSTNENAHLVVEPTTSGRSAVHSTQLSAVGPCVASSLKLYFKFFVNS